MIRSLKRKSDELERIYNSDKESIVCGIKLEANGKNITSESTQALMVMHEEKKIALYNTNRNIKWLKAKVAQLQNKRSNSLDDKINLNQRSEKIKKSVHDILDKKIGIYDLN